MKQESLFKKYQGALIFKGLPHQKIEIKKGNLLILVIKTHSIFARYFTNSELLVHRESNSKNKIFNASISEENKQQDKMYWWHCLRDQPIYLEKLTSKQRYRVNKGLKLNDIELISEKIDGLDIDQIEKVLVAVFNEYPEMYRGSSNLRGYAKQLISYAGSDIFDLWTVKDKETNNIVGIAVCQEKDGMIDLQKVHVDPNYHKNEVNAALVYKICKYYLNEKEFLYVCDGERNIRHITNYQDFLIKNLGFRNVSCQLRVVYHPIVYLIVKLLYPFRKFIEKSNKKSKFLYNISATLKQEDIVRKCKKLYNMPFHK